MFKKIVDLLKKKGRPEEEIEKEISRLKNESIEKAARLTKLINAEDAGWKEFYALVNDYIRACKERKVNTNLFLADENVLKKLKDLDHEVYLLEWVLQIPQQYINKIDKMAKDSYAESLGGKQ